MARSTPPQALAGAHRRAAGTRIRTSADRPATVLVASDWAPIRAFEPIVRERPEAVYGDLLPVLRRADLRIVNCECALTSATSPVWKSGAVFKGDAAHVAGLRAVPFEVACLANNHVLDYGVAGLREHLRVLTRAGIRTVGAGLTEAQALVPLSVRVNGQSIHIINISEGEDLTASTGGPGVFGWDVPLAARAGTSAEETRRRGDRDRALRTGVRAVPAAVRRRRVPGACRGWRRLRHRPSSARAPGHRMVARPSDSLQPRQLRVLSAHDAASIGRRVLREPALRRRPDHGDRAAPVPDHGHGPAASRPEGSAGLRPGSDTALSSLQHRRRARPRLECVAGVLR